MPELLCAVAFVILRLAILVQYRFVTHRRTDRQTDKQTQARSI